MAYNIKTSRQRCYRRHPLRLGRQSNNFEKQRIRNSHSDYYDSEGIMTPIQRQNAENRALLAQRQQNYASGPSMLYSSGTQEEREKEMSGLETARVGYGQNLFEIGSDVNRVRNLQRERTEGSDPISEAIRNQKAGAVANANRNLASSGVKGGAAAGAADSVARTRDAEIASSMYGQQANNIAAERSCHINFS